MGRRSGRLSLLRIPFTRQLPPGSNEMRTTASPCSRAETRTRFARAGTFVLLNGIVTVSIVAGSVNVHALTIAEARAAQRGSQFLPQDFEADVAAGCQKLRAWPGGTNIGEEVVQQLRKYMQVTGYQNVGTMAKFNRCLAGAMLISAGEFPDKARNALVLLDRSLAYDSSQNLLRQNIATLNNILGSNGGNVSELMTAILQILRGANDPDIPRLVKQLQAAAQPK
jgi:hypothetical protein